MSEFLPPNTSMLYQLPHAHREEHGFSMHGNRYTIHGSIICDDRESVERFCGIVPRVEFMSQDYGLDYRIELPLNGHVEFLESPQERKCVTLHMYDDVWADMHHSFSLYIPNTIDDIVLTRQSETEWAVDLCHEDLVDIEDRLTTCVYTKDIIRLKEYIEPNKFRTTFVIKNSTGLPLQRCYYPTSPRVRNSFLVIPVGSIVRPQEE